MSRTRPTSQRTRAITRWFGLNRQRDPSSPGLSPEPHLLAPTSGQILLITGPSGAGKSSLLRAILTASPFAHPIDLNRLALPRRAVVDCFGRIPINRALKLLSRVGLAEAWTYVRTPDELSDGQRWRLRLAMGLHRLQRHHDSMLISDEFCALLDRVTAAIVARSLRRIIDDTGARAIVATAHDDLIVPLSPDVVVKCDFGNMQVCRNAKAA